MHKIVQGMWLSVCTLVLCLPTTQAADWLHWRGPAQTGQSWEKNLPDDWDPATPGKQNLIWKVPYGCRTTPLVMNGKVYITSALGDTPFVPGPKEKLVTGERVACFDAETGKPIWEKQFNVFHTDIVTNRLGWSPLAADPANKLVFAHLTGGELAAFKADTGDIVWLHSLTEEYGRVTGYGGRVGGGPIFDSGLVIVGIVQASWGNHAVGGNRWVAFDSTTGKVVWWAETPNPIKGTYYSNPVIAVINGQRLMITGGADGAIHAFQVRTGKRVWSHMIASGVINPSPVVDGNYVYISHGEENPEGAANGLGRVVCLNAAKVTAGKPEVVWEFKRGIRFGLASLALADGKLYIPDDAAKLYCFDAKKGKVLWKYNYGTTSRGAPVIADGKVYICETNYKFQIIKLNGDEEPSESKTKTITFRNKPGAAGFVEVNSTPSIANGRMYIGTRDELYCIGYKDWKPSMGSEGPKELVDPPAKEGDAIAQLQLIPADVVAKPGDSLTFEVRAYNAAGALIKTDKLNTTWAIPQPPAAKAGAPLPPPLDATVDEAGKVTLGKKPSQHGYVDVKVGEVSGRARVRVAGGIPYKQDFAMVPVGATPGGWVNTQGKYSVVEVPNADGTKSKALFKKNDDPRPPLARAIAYITGPEAKDYTIEADVMGVEKKDKLPDAGLVANRYTFYLDGKTEDGKREVRLISWEALPRINVTAPFTWKSGTWYRMKLAVVVGDKDGVVKCKVWERGQPEPEKWNIEFTDPMPNRNGAAGLYGYITNAEPTNPGSEILFANVAITPNKK